MAGSGSRDNAIHLVFSVVLAFLLTIVILLLTSFLMLKAGIGGTVVTILVILSCTLPLFIGGFFMGRHVDKSRYLWGLAVGAVYLAIYIILSLIIKTEPRPELSDYLKRGILILLSAAFGGMLS